MLFADLSDSDSVNVTSAHAPDLAA